jgi:DNA-binding SARP family transcriptional activator
MAGSSGMAVNGLQTCGREDPPMATRDPGGKPEGAPAPSPPNVSNAVVRSSVLDRLEARWDHTVTTVLAGAGFGKSVAIGQALRANRARPRGVEAWISCRAGCETPERVVTSFEAAFGVESTGQGTAAARLYDLVAGLAPLHASLVVDDAELLPESAAALLDDLLRRAPSNLHLVLVGRQLPPLALARLRAAGDVVEVGEEHLRFNEREIVALASSLGAEPLELDLAGWPALVRLALVAPRRSVEEYLWEEVISALGSADRESLLALCLLGPSRVEELESVTGRPFDADGFCARVPLVHRADDHLVAHDLWTPYLRQLGDAEEIDGVARRVMDAVASRGDAIGSGATALRLGDDEALGRATLEMVRDTIGSLPIELAESWLSALRARRDGGDRAEAELLECALAHCRSASEPSAERLDRLAERFHAAGDRVGEAASVALGTLAADARNDVSHLVSLATRARRLVETYDEPRLQILVTAVDAAIAAIGGDLDGALHLLDEPAGGVEPSQRVEGLVRLHWHFLILAGRAGDAARLTAHLEPVPGLTVQRELSRVARWLDGDPSALHTASVGLGPDRYQRLSARDAFDQAAFVAILAASGVEPGPVHDAVAVLEASPFASDAGPDGAMLAVARACRAIVDHDDDAASAVIARFVEQGPLDAFTEAHLRRNLAVPYVCSPELRRRWDGTDLGPSHARARDIARLLVEVRAGTVPADPPPVLASVPTALPMPWSVELALRAAAKKAPWGTDLAVRLTDDFGDGVLGEITHRLEDPDDAVRRGATVVLGALPARPPASVGIRVLGPLRVTLDDRPIDPPELHRTRVRMLLSLLVVERTVTRDRVVDLLWPDLVVSRGRANLRVTLRHLQRLLEPERDQRSAPYFVRGDARQLQLVDADGLEVDLWQAEDLLAAAEADRRRGDAARRIEHLRAAVDLWRGRPLADLELVADVEHLARNLETRLIDASLALGELELVGGAVDAAAALAVQALVADPYLERAHRLAIAAHLHGRDRSATATAVERLTTSLDELGARPEAETQILLRNVADWLRPVRTPVRT